VLWEAFEKSADSRAHRYGSLVPGLGLPAVLGADVKNVVGVIHVIPREMLQLADT